MNTIDILKIAQKMEVKGMEFYKTQKDLVKSESLKSTFQYLTEMEKEHADYLQKQINNLNNNKPLDKLPDNEDTKLSDIFDKQKVIPDNPDDNFSDYSITRIAYLIEKDFAEYYKHASEKEIGEAKEIFNTLHKWEVTHEEIMKSRLQNIIKKNAIEEKFFEPLY